MTSTIDERAAELRAFRERLRSTDQIERAAAFEVGIASSDEAVRQMTLREAFGSSYKDLKTVALRHWVSAKAIMIVQLTMPDKPSPATLNAQKADLGEQVLLESLLVNEKGQISAVHRRSGMRFLGLFAASSMMLDGSGGHLRHCDLNLAVVDGSLLSGALRCIGLDPLVARVHID